MSDVERIEARCSEKDFHSHLAPYKDKNDRRNRILLFVAQRAIYFRLLVVVT